jgi:hypothetical protein
MHADISPDKSKGSLPAPKTIRMLIALDKLMLRSSTGTGSGSGMLSRTVLRKSRPEREHSWFS